MAEAARIMCDYQVGCVVVTEGEKLVGIVTSTDVVRVYLDADRVIREITLKETAGAPAKSE